MWDIGENTSNYNKDVCYYTCPKKSCRKVKPSYLKSFQRNNLDKLIRCQFCKHKSIANTWTCTCGKKWHTCQIHGKGFDQTIIRPTPKPKPKAKVKAKPSLHKRAAQLTHEQILEQEARLTKVRIVSPTTAVMTASGRTKEGQMTKMGPKILERFGYLLNKEKQ